ncbi:hypothetical protein ACHAWU_006349 [Discostella pseudostelligera]|uniref:Uncharacterized protein n=1 Tax=Discostella pseudostelligera TaxID=259834 RepID=A0ABD3M0A1_9STRA
MDSSKRQGHLLCSAFAIAILAVLRSASAWTPTAINQRSRTGMFPSSLLSTPDAANPCWQDNYDSEDDCLSTIYSAAFVAEEWIKSMPCGKDADCLPENLSHPGTMGDSGVEKVDVMEFLNIRKAVPVTEKR